MSWKTLATSQRCTPLFSFVPYVYAQRFTSGHCSGYLRLFVVYFRVRFR